MAEPLSARIHVDGASRGNPGPAAFAFVIVPSSGPTVERAEVLSPTTNNVAEYTALVAALKAAHDLDLTHLTIFSDSELMVKQIGGQYQVKNADLRPLYDEAKGLIRHFANVTLSHVRREGNKRADELCNIALDAAGSVAKGPEKKVAPGKSAPKAKGIDDRLYRDELVDFLDTVILAAKRGEEVSGAMVWDQVKQIMGSEE